MAMLLISHLLLMLLPFHLVFAERCRILIVNWTDVDCGAAYFCFFYYFLVFLLDCHCHFFLFSLFSMSKRFFLCHAFMFSCPILHFHQLVLFIVSFIHVLLRLSTTNVFNFTCQNVDNYFRVYVIWNNICIYMIK